MTDVRKAYLRATMSPIVAAAFDVDALALLQLVQDDGVNLQDQDGIGFTAMHWAAMHCSPVIVACLVDIGDDPNVVKNVLGHTPAELFAQFTAEDRSYASSTSPRDLYIHRCIRKQCKDSGVDPPDWCVLNR
jgi:hypothetical protein